ncbi:DUF2188 domain-containing protein [Pseudomonas entomophila]|uniref:DUF2188 domain-containing protein n=1 Tax=Pseudomonas entomophila TaxID=312306 RepID=UPI003EBDE162
MDTYHVVTHGQGWALRRSGSEAVLVQADTKAGLVGRLAEVLQGKTASVKIHRADGTIEEERTYPRSADPRRTEG